MQSLVVSETKGILQTTGENVDCLRLETPKWMEVSDEVLRYLQKAVKISSRDCRIVEIVLQNNQRDEAGVSGDELSSLLSDLKKRMRRVCSLTVNLDHWGLLFMVLPNIAEQLSSFGNNQLLELTIISNNKSLNPSVTNKTVRTLGLILKDLPSLRKLELQLDDNSTQKKKQIEKEGFSCFCEGLAALSSLTSLDLQLGGWFSFFRHHIKEQDDSMEQFSQAISSNKKQLQHLRLSLKYWEDIEFQHLTLICKSLLRNQVPRQLRTCSLDFIRWSYFNSQNQLAAVDSLAALIHDLSQCNTLSISFFNLGTGFQEQRDLKRNSIPADGNNSRQANINFPRGNNNEEVISASPDLLKRFVNEINKKKKLKALELSIHEYVAIGGMKVLRDSLFTLSSLTSLKISTQSEPYEAKKYLSTLVAVPKCRKRVILFLQACKQSEKLKLFRKDFLIHLACISFNMLQN